MAATPRQGIELDFPSEFDFRLKLPDEGFDTARGGYIDYDVNILRGTRDAITIVSKRSCKHVIH
jgi:hypothetical protein